MSDDIVSRLRSALHFVRDLSTHPEHAEAIEDAIAAITELEAVKERLHKWIDSLESENESLRTALAERDERIAERDSHPTSRTGCADHCA